MIHRAKGPYPALFLQLLCSTTEVCLYTILVPEEISNSLKRRLK